MTSRHACPVCGERTLVIQPGVGGLFVLCSSSGCDRDSILAALSLRDAPPRTIETPTGRAPTPQWRTYAW